ncbi:GNAT family N-acetyltransferase [Actinoplanes sp. NPDC023801]|uniref:GNAT family N-acetyltransferase n=1 Tax=Actinoplanes sp. NPDC023801 TaxID=3154595 RepID=UPI0033DA89D5
MRSVADIEEHAVGAWPATHAERADGWLLRHTPGVGKRRNNSALPPPGAAGGIDAAERFYRERGMPVIVQVSPAEEHEALDGVLAARGYRYEAPTLVLTAAPGEVMRPVPEVTISTGLTSGWRSAYGNDAVSEHVLDRIAPATGFASIVVDGSIAALGLFVVDGGIGGVFCMATDPRHRRRGLAEAILRAGAAWSAERGAELLYLQVEGENAAARQLYAKVGFQHSHSYHYRVFR